VNWYGLHRCFFSGMFLANAVPHFVHGISGDRFPTPFARPPGKGLSSPTVNVVWALFNLVVGTSSSGRKGLEGRQLSTRYFLRRHRCHKHDVERAICQETGQVGVEGKPRDVCRSASRTIISKFSSRMHLTHRPGHPKIEASNRTPLEKTMALIKRKLGNSGLELPQSCLRKHIRMDGGRSNIVPVAGCVRRAGFNAVDTADVYSKWVPGNRGGSPRRSSATG